MLDCLPIKRVKKNEERNGQHCKLHLGMKKIAWANSVKTEQRESISFLFLWNNLTTAPSFFLLLAGRCREQTHHLYIISWENGHLAIFKTRFRYNAIFKTWFDKMPISNLRYSLDCHFLIFFYFRNLFASSSWWSDENAPGAIGGGQVGGNFRQVRWKATGAAPGGAVRGVRATALAGVLWTRGVRVAAARVRRQPHPHRGAPSARPDCAPQHHPFSDLIREEFEARFTGLAANGDDEAADAGHGGGGRPPC